ncbi:hypothetical protein [Nocardioides marmoraquaticus]
MTRPTRRRIATGLLAAALLITSAACGDDDTEPNTLPSDPATSETSSTPSPSEPTETTAEPATEEDRAAEGAMGEVRDFTAFRDELLGDPEAATITEQRLGAYLQNPELTAQLTYLTRFRDQGFRTNGGSTTFEWMKVTDVQLFPKKNDAQVSLRACYNYDAVTTLDKDGNDAAPNQISPGLATYEVYNYDYPSPDGWHIAVETIPGRECK